LPSSVFSTSAISTSCFYHPLDADIFEVSTVSSAVCFKFQVSIRFDSISSAVLLYCTRIAIASSVVPICASRQPLRLFAFALCDKSRSSCFRAAWRCWCCWPKEIVGVFVDRTRAKAVVLMLSDDAAATSDWRKHRRCYSPRLPSASLAFGRCCS